MESKYFSDECTWIIIDARLAVCGSFSTAEPNRDGLCIEYRQVREAHTREALQATTHDREHSCEETRKGNGWILRGLFFVTAAWGLPITVKRGTLSLIPQTIQ